MADARPHGDWAERADKLAEDARRRTAQAHAGAARHERLAAQVIDVRQAAEHRRAATMYRDAAALYEQTAALQAIHADHERRAAGRPDTGDPAATVPRPEPPDLPGLADRYGRLAHQQALADERDRIADARDRAADERERAADERDRAADQRDRIATAREKQLDELEHQLSEATGHQTTRLQRRAQLARASSAVDRAHGGIARQGEALDRADVHAADEQAAIDREIATSQRHEAAALLGAGSREPPPPRPASQPAATLGASDDGEPGSARPSAERHERAARTHDDAAARHESAAAFWDARDDPHRAELARRGAELERELAALERDQAALLAGSDAPTHDADDTSAAAQPNDRE